VGVPPLDLIEHVFLAWAQAGLDAAVCMRMCASVTKEYVYEPNEELIRRRLRPNTVNNKLLPVRNRPLEEVLDPQPRCSAVLHRLLEWIDRCRPSLPEHCMRATFAIPNSAPPTSHPASRLRLRVAAWRAQTSVPDSRRNAYHPYRR
jgi:hypothetical protein